MTKDATTFDLFDLEDSSQRLDDLIEQKEMEVEQWAKEQLADRPIDQGKPVFFDIETGPRPTEEIEAFYKPPEPLPPFDESTVKYGNTKDKDKRAEKLAQVKAEYQAILANEATTRAAHKAEWLGKAALSPVTGRVLLIGWLSGNGDADPIQGDEADMLTEFWSRVETSLDRKQSMIGHNSNGFDLPFLVRRSWALSVSVPREVRQGRYFNPLFKDTMEAWNLGQRDYVSLNTLGAFFGAGQKTEGVSGGDFARLWFGQMPADPWGTPAEQHAKAIEYNGQDLILTAAIAAKMGMV